MLMPLTTRLKYTLGRYLPFLKIRPPDVDRQDVLVLRPGRNALITWEKLENGTTLLRIPENKSVGWLTRMMAKWLHAPTERKVELDEVGGFVWELCDGKNTIEAIVQKLSREYKMNRREAEVSGTLFLQTLLDKNYIGLYKKASKAELKQAEAKRESTRPSRAQRRGDRATTASNMEQGTTK
ncbi:MAG TPA: PqqD family protein [Chthonomonadaceae bacterium]|nr:PqqD family protein [Chthonomonadaceae bacterium]